MSASYRVRGQPTSRRRPSQYRSRSGSQGQLLAGSDLASRPTWQPLTQKTKPATTANFQPTAAVEQTRLLPPPAMTRSRPQLVAGDLAAQQTRPLLAKKSLSPKEREQLVADHRQLVDDALQPHWSAAASQRTRFGLAQAAQIGLLLAAESFDPSRQRLEQFADHARPLIAGEIAVELS